MTETLQAPLWSYPDIWIAGLIGLAAAIEDLARRTISNWLSILALAGGAACQFHGHGWRGLGTAALGAAAGFAVFLVFYLLGGMGGGDVKLMAGFGALLGWDGILRAAFLTALLGGVIAAAVLGFAAIRKRFRGQSSPAAIPYAPAIVLGVWLALLSTK